jgi:glucose/arabinose dehydrogenase
MRPRPVVPAVAALAVLVVLAACAGGSPSGTAPGSTTSATPAAPATPTTGAPDSCAVSKPAPPTGAIPARFATALAFAPDGRLFFAEREGTVRVWQAGSAKEFARVATVTTEAGGGGSERGLLGLAVSPTFTSDRFVFAFYSDADRAHSDVIRWTDCAGEGTAPKVIVQLPSGSDCCHKGGRLAFGTDGKLYVTLGDEHTATAAQDTSDVRGKILRYNPDGTIPPDNPFGADDPVWASGFRNPFGIAFSAGGQLAVTVNGPTGDAGSPATGYDSVATNVARGGTYQWPSCYGYSHPVRAGGSCSGREPEWSSESATFVPTGAAFVTAAGPAPYAGHLVFCTLSHGMQVLTEGSPHAAVAPGEDGCLLDVRQGPDNALYFSDTDHIYRLG